MMNVESEKRMRWFMELDVTELEELLITDLTDDERFDVVAIRILKEHMGAFIELAK